MQINHLRCFITLCNHRSLTKTSHALNTTPQNVSRILKNLETEMNTILFTRNHDGILLTPSGERFLKFAKSMVYQYDAMKADFSYKKSQDQTEQYITLYSNNIINELILNDILTSFFLDYPSIIINNRVVSWKDGYHSVLNSESDIGFLLYFPENAFSDELTIVPAFEFHPVVIMNPHHPLATCKRCTKNQLLTYKLITNSNDDILNTALFFALNLDPVTQKNTITTSGNINACYQLVSNSDYVTFGTAETFAKLNENWRNKLVALPIEDYYSTSCALFKKKDLPPDSPQQLLFSYILNHLSQGLITNK